MKFPLFGSNQETIWWRRKGKEREKKEKEKEEKRRKMKEMNRVLQRRAPKAVLALTNAGCP